MASVTVRVASSAEVSAISDLAERAYAVYVERIGRRPAPMDDDYAQKIRGGHTFVAVDRGQLAGFVVLLRKPDHLLIENVAVDPESQGQGIGRVLLDHAEALALEYGTRTVKLYTNAAMVENLALYAHIGYRVIERRPEDGFERVFLAKDLAA